MSATAVLDAPSVKTWPQAKLAEVADIVNGGTPKSNVAEFWDGEHQWLTPADMGKMVGREIAKTPRTITAIGLAKSSARLAPPRSVILSTRAPIGHLAINSVPMAFNQGCRALVPGPKLDHVFLYYFLLHSRDLLNELGTGTTFRELSATSLKTVQMPLPPLEEQKRIVAVLDQAFAALDRARALAEANLADSGELFEASKRRFSSLGADQATTVSLGEVVSITAKLVDPKLPAYLDLPHIGAGNMVTGTDDLVEIQTAREEGLKSGKFPFAAGVILYSKIRPYLRKVARPDFDGLCSADVYPLTPSKHLDRDYLFHLLLSEDFTAYAIAGSARAGMPKVNQEHLFAYRFDLPPVEAQRAISKSIDAALVSRKQLLNLSERKLAQLIELRQSLLQTAFVGELA